MPVMDALLQSVSQTVAHDVRELVHAAAPHAPAPAGLEEIEPPNLHWGVPLGFVSLLAAGALLVAAAGVQEQWQAQRTHQSARRHRTHLHKHKLRAGPLRRGA